MGNPLGPEKGAKEFSSSDSLGTPVYHSPDKSRPIAIGAISVVI
jgi:hypothetical protein